MEVDARNLDLATPLYMSAQQGQPELVAELLARGADPRLGAIGNQTPLHAAAEAGEVRSVEFLLAAGADPRARTLKGKTPRDVALEEEHGEIASLLETSSPR